MSNKNLSTDSIRHVREVAQNMAAQIVLDTFESMGYEPEDLSVSLFLKDNSKVKWKSNSKFVKLYVTELNRMLDKKKLDIEKTGFVTVLASYIDFQDNYLKNSKGEYLAQKDIIEITGLSRKKVSKLLNELINDEVIFQNTQKDDNRKKRYYINPNLLFRGSEINKSVKEYFDNK